MRYCVKFIPSTPSVSYPECEGLPSCRGDASNPQVRRGEVKLLGVLYGSAGFQIRGWFWRQQYVACLRVFSAQYFYRHETDTWIYLSSLGLGTVAWCVLKELGSDNTESALRLGWYGIQIPFCFATLIFSANRGTFQRQHRQLSPTNTTTSPTEQRVNQNMRVDCDGYRKQASLLNNQLPYYKTLQYFIQ